MSELKKKAIHGIKWTTLSSLIIVVGGLAQTIILARLLTKSDFGQMAIVNVIVGFSVHLVDMGFSNAIIRESQVSHRQLSTLFWINVMIGAFLSAMIWLFSDNIAAFYDMEDLDALLKIISPAFLITSIGVQNLSILQKELRFRHLAFCEGIPFLLSFFAVIYLAYQGHGVFSLVYGVLLRSLMSTIISLALSGKRAASVRYFSLQETRPFLAFGSVQVLEKFLSYFNMNVDVLLIGKFLGKDVLGAYEIAKRLLVQPLYVVNPLINKVTFPIISMVKQDKERVKNISLRALELVMFINAPIYIAAFVGAPVVIEALFGAKWLVAVEAFRWLAVVYFVRSMANPFGSIIMASVKIREILYFQLASSSLLLTLLWAGFNWGETGFYSMYALFTIAFFWGSIRFQVGKVLDIDMTLIAKKVLPDIFILVILSVIVYAGISLAPVNPILQMSIYIVILGLLIVGVYLTVLKKTILTEIRDLINKI